MVAEPGESAGVRGTEEELQARAADLSRQGALPLESVVEVAQSAEPLSSWSGSSARRAHCGREPPLVLRGRPIRSAAS